ncbi:hypothetical protein E4T80_09995 [Muribacter muris]|uniref:Uncharacterized protein n=1 Tax=Muribacter muris TaxID=67855 RepID=A0A4Y9JTG9_9PAST|nr:hypothetical protein [Muribacter muris]MBF0785791.1 hypothetical protein [Muribacter muris]MBF0828237.1 hypothetical protein [Muribacter muris]TFV08612.1 hypothetical protein E4T80_09995 [Muribacter muris]
MKKWIIFLFLYSFIIKAYSVNNSISMTPEQKAYFDLMAKPTEDVTGFGIKQAEDFNRQMAAFPNVTPIQRFQAFENFKNDWNRTYLQQGYSTEQIERISLEFSMAIYPLDKGVVEKYRSKEQDPDRLAGFDVATDFLALNRGKALGVMYNVYHSKIQEKEKKKFNAKYIAAFTKYANPYGEYAKEILK